MQEKCFGKKKKNVNEDIERYLMFLADKSYLESIEIKEEIIDKIFRIMDEYDYFISIAKQYILSGVGSFNEKTKLYDDLKGVLQLERVEKFGRILEKETRAVEFWNEISWQRNMEVGLMVIRTISGVANQEQKKEGIYMLKYYTDSIVEKYEDLMEFVLDVLASDVNYFSEDELESLEESLKYIAGAPKIYTLLQLGLSDD